MDLKKFSISLDGQPAQCDERQWSELEALGWKRAGAPAAPVAAVVVGQVKTLQDIVDDRALPYLKARGIVSVEDFLAADTEVLLGAPYINERSLPRSIAKAQ